MNEEKKVPFKWEYGEETISLQLGMYANNQRLYIGMITHTEDGAEPFADMTVNLPRYSLDPGEAFISGDISKDLLRFIKENKLGKVLPYQVQSGYGKYSAVAFDLEKLKVFDKNSPYLPTRKIGKNNPKAEEIRIDNYLRQEWNHMVDRAVTEGVTEEELCQVKKKEITVPAHESIIKEGWKPDQFQKILQKAIGKLRGFIQFMKEIRNGEFEARGNPLIRPDLRFDVTLAPLPETAKGERPSSALQEAEVMKLDRILLKLKKAEQKIYSIEKAKLRLEKNLKEVQKKWFHGKEKKELEQKIAEKRQELKKAQETLSEIPQMQGYENALEVKKAYKAAVSELEEVRKLQSEWEQKGIPEKKYWVIKANVPEKTRQKSIHERLEEVCIFRL